MRIVPNIERRVKRQKVDKLGSKYRHILSHLPILEDQT